MVKSDSQDSIETAAMWDARLRAPDCTEKERAAYRAWRSENGDNAATFEALQDILSGMRTEEGAPGIRSMRDAALNEARKGMRRKRYMQWGLALAACVALVFAASPVLTPNYRGGDALFPEAAITAMHMPPFYATAIGERSTVTLEDGTIATLNTDTRLRIDYKENERLVTLLQGQALFDVAKNPDRPFIVAAGEQRIRAVGTIFDVFYDLSKVQVTMLEGVVVVASEDDEKHSDSAASSEAAAQTTLKAGQQLLADAEDSQRVVREADVERETIWREGRVFFEDLPLTDAIAEMNRYSTMQIVAADPELAGFRVNGMFRTGQQAGFVDAVETYFPINAQQVSKDRIVLSLASHE